MQSVDTEAASSTSGPAQNISSSPSAASDSHQPGRYICSVCGKEFPARWRLVEHGQVHTGATPYQCAQCGKRYPYRSCLSRHMNIHREKYRCPECGRCCESRGEMAKHARSHSGERPFLCTVCGRRFKLSVDLTRHARRHAGVRRFVCPLCERAYLQPLNLRRHMASVHADIADTPPPPLPSIDTAPATD